MHYFQISSFIFSINSGRRRWTSCFLLTVGLVRLRAVSVSVLVVFRLSDETKRTREEEEENEGERKPTLNLCKNIKWPPTLKDDDRLHAKKIKALEGG